MRCVRIMPVLLMLATASCASQKAVEATTRVERRDTLRAVLAEELTVRLDDVVIIPPDSLRPRIIAAKVELQRDRTASVSHHTAERIITETITKTTPKSPSWRLPVWVTLTVGLASFIAGAWRSK